MQGWGQLLGSIPFNQFHSLQFLLFNSNSNFFQFILFNSNLIYNHSVPIQIPAPIPHSKS